MKCAKNWAITGFLSFAIMVPAQPAWADCLSRYRSALEYRLGYLSKKDRGVYAAKGEKTSAVRTLTKKAGQGGSVAQMARVLSNAAGRPTEKAIWQSHGLLIKLFSTQLHVTLCFGTARSALGQWHKNSLKPYQKVVEFLQIARSVNEGRFKEDADFHGTQFWKTYRHFKRSKPEMSPQDFAKIVSIADHDGSLCRGKDALKPRALDAQLLGTAQAVQDAEADGVKILVPTDENAALTLPVIEEE
jgi:hypothetical protein